MSATACSSPWRMTGAKRSSVRASSNSPKRLRLSSSQLIVARIPCSIRRKGSGSSASGLALRAPQVALGFEQDLDEKRLFGLEVPVEDAFADPEPLCDVGDRRRVVALGGEALGGVVEQLLSPPLTPRGEAPCHDRRQ